MPMRLVVFVSSLALAVATGAQATPPKGTLSGTVTRGPISPVCALEQPCDEPAANVTLLFTRNGAVVGRIVTNDEGRYRLRLPAGSYGVRRPAATGAFDTKLEPNHARVYAGRLGHIDFAIDTGIR
jgi:hypothetical protein